MVAFGNILPDGIKFIFPLIYDILLWNLQYVPPVGHIYGLFGALVRHASAGSELEPITLVAASDFLKFLQK